MLTDFKFWYIRRHDDGHIEECGIRFYEGDITTEDEDDGSGDIVPVTRYRRSKRLGKADLSHLSSRNTKRETSGAESFVYTEADFGRIFTDEELVAFLKTELKKDKKREPIPPLV